MRASEDGTATCSSCTQTKPVTGFYKLPYGGKGVKAVCKDCTRPRARAAELRRKFGITVAQYEAQIERQGGRCAACGTPEEETPEWKSARGPRRLGVDLVAYGAMRGLLCVHCRMLVGEMETWPEIVAAAAAYLRGDSPWIKAHP